jgi:hypothetical protein
VAAGQAPAVQLFGQGLLQQDVKVHARQQGHFLKLPAAARPLGQALQVQLPRLEAAGLVRLELEQDVLVSSAVPLLVVPSAGLAAELLELQQRLGPGSELLCKVGGGGCSGPYCLAAAVAGPAMRHAAAAGCAGSCWACRLTQHGLPLPHAPHRC